ncbi:phosphatase PAP2 family protein [Halorubrum tibetense]|uniref:Phosphatase PAP2 family protein n=1 Tax=Halorubrum tibetense TaxID=175631 RepID=A0ABD5SGC9_9EURY
MSPFLSAVSGLLLWLSALTLIAGVTIIGPRRLYDVPRNLVHYLQEAKRYVAVLVAVMFVSAVGRAPLQTVSELIGLRLTGYIYAFEGGFVGWVQTFATAELTLYFSWMYVYGYAFLLVFPFIAYAALSTSTTLKRLMLAYALNYGLGLVMYTLVLAYGPRNVMPDLVTPLLYTFNPEYRALTGEVNVPTNVFPSLHTSLSVTVAAFAALTYDEYRAWAPIAAWIAGSVVVATMYLGIHWAVDVVAGIALALGSVYLSYRIVDDAGESTAGPTNGPTDGSTDPSSDAGRTDD